MLSYSYSNIKKGINCAKNFSTKVLFLVMLLAMTLEPLKFQAQQYPVKLIPVVLAPYSLKLGDYATSTENKLQLQVLMTDLMEPQHQVGLRFSLESGLNSVPFAQSNDFVVGMFPFMLYPGTNITLTNVDLRSLFELQNLSGISGLQYSQALPEGIYHYCFQAYDYYTHNTLSAKTCATAYLIQYDPPILNLPQNAEKIQALMPYGSGGGVVFQWMPQQIAPNTKYIFTLKEIWDLGQSPISGYLSSRVLWQEETPIPSLYYGIDKPQLIPGKRYGWQVQAKSGNPVFGSNPTEDNGVYKNNGLSEIYYFDYVENCAVPTLLMAKNVGRGRVEISWSLNRQPSGLYVVQYRKKNSNSEWMTQQSYQSPAILTGLADLTEYEYRVGSVCGNLSNYNNTNQLTTGNSAGNTYSYSSIQYFTTNGNDASNNYQCGVMPSIDITNKNPLQSLLGVNEVFTAGDFPVTVLSAQGSNGIYTGTGYIQVPYLGDTRIKVRFSNIKLNSDKKLIEGIIETTYDPAETAVAYTSAGLGETFGDSGIKEISIKFPISNISYSATPPPGVITIHGSDGNSSGNGSQTEYPGGVDYTFTDPDGKIWTVDENGNITGPQQIAEGGVSTSSNTEGVSGMGGHATINQYTAKGIKIEWEENILGKYAYDTHEKTKLPANQYPSVKDADNQTVSIPYKATVNKETELFNAIVHISDPALKDAKIVFKTLSAGKTIEATEKTKTDTRREYELKLKGTFDYAEEEVIAVLMPQNSTAKQKIISSFRLVHLGKKEAKVHLVPLDGASESKLSTIESTIGSIYKKIGVEYEFVKEEVLDISTLGIGSQIESGDSKLMNTYGSDQEKINDYYATHRGKGLKYVLFVTEKPSSKGQDGYMRLNGQFGYLFKNAPSKTAAHELGHGIFKLEHPSESLNISESSTPLLMDVRKGNDDIILSHLDWKQVNDPSFKFYGFQQQSSGEFSGGYAVAPDYSIFSVSSTTVTDKIDYTIEKYSGYSDDGTLPGFKQNNKFYCWDFDKNKYVAKTYKEDGSIDAEYYYDLQKIEKNKLDPKKYIYLFFNKKNPCGLTTYKYILADKYINFTGNSLSEFIHANDGERKYLPCGNNSTENDGNTNNNWQYEEKAKGNTDDDCIGFTYLPTPTAKDIQLVQNAFLKGFNARKSIISEERNQGTFNHIQIANATSSSISGDLPSNEMELLEDKLHLLTYYRKDIYVGVVFLKKDAKEFYKQDALDELSLKVIQRIKSSLGGKKALLIVVPYSYKFNRKSKCLPSLGFAQTQDNDVVKYSDVKTDNAKNWFTRILAVYSQVPKPLIINRYYKTADGIIIQRIERVPANIKGYPFIKTLNFYESKGYDAMRKLNDEYKNTDYQNILTIYYEYLAKAKQIYFDYTTREQQEDAINNPAIWKQISTDDLGKFREIYMDKSNLTNKLWEKSKDSWAWGSKVEIALNIPSEDVQLEPKHFYNFDKMVLLDDVVYGVLDGIGLIPGIDTFTDPIGAVYAGIRGDYSNATIYTASFAIPLAGSAYIKGSLKVGEDAAKLYGIVARNADNADGYILDFKKISEINEDELHISSVFWGGDQKLTQKVLDEIKNNASKYVDGNYVRKTLAQLTNNLATLISRIDNLPNLSIVERNALKADISASVELKNLFVKNIDKTGELSDAWKTILNARGANSVFKKDLALLNKVTDLKKNSSFMQNIGGNKGLEKIIKNNVQAPCKSCGNSGSKYLKNIDDYLDDVEHFVNNFKDVSNAQRLINELKNGSQYTVEGGAFAVRMFKENPGGIFTKGQISAIDFRFSEDILNRFDVKFKNGFGEFKSYQIESISNVSVNQLEQYLATPDLTKLSDLNYFFDKRKLLQEFGTGTFSTINDATEAVKNKFKTIFSGAKKQEIFDAIWSNPNLRNDLFEANITKADAILDFDDLINDTKSALYNFIKVQ